MANFIDFVRWMKLGTVFTRYIPKIKVRSNNFNPAGCVSNTLTIFPVDE